MSAVRAASSTVGMALAASRSREAMMSNDPAVVELEEPLLLLPRPRWVRSNQPGEPAGVAIDLARGYRRRILR